jgi:hypothetical protein
VQMANAFEAIRISIFMSRFDLLGWL